MVLEVQGVEGVHFFFEETKTTQHNKCTFQAIYFSTIMDRMQISFSFQMQKLMICFKYNVYVRLCAQAVKINSMVLRVLIIFIRLLLFSFVLCIVFVGLIMPYVFHDCRFMKWFLN